MGGDGGHAGGFLADVTVESKGLAWGGLHPRGVRCLLHDIRACMWGYVLPVAGAACAEWPTAFADLACAVLLLLLPAGHVGAPAQQICRGASMVSWGVRVAGARVVELLGGVWGGKGANRTCRSERGLH